MARRPRLDEPVQIESELEDLTEEFAECCAIQAWFVREGWISKRQAVDNLQHIVESLHVPAEDRDAAQAIMAEAFKDRDEAEEEDLPSDYAARIVRQWELNDPRDRWQYSDEPRPQAEETPIEPRRYRTPQSTIDAFWHVAGLDRPDQLTAWLSQHPRDVETLQRLWEAKHAGA